MEVKVTVKSSQGETYTRNSSFVKTFHTTEKRWEEDDHNKEYSAEHEIPETVPRQTEDIKNTSTPETRRTIEEKQFPKSLMTMCRNNQWKG